MAENKFIELAKRRDLNLFDKLKSENNIISNEISPQKEYKKVHNYMTSLDLESLVKKMAQIDEPFSRTFNFSEISNTIINCENILSHHYLPEYRSIKTQYANEKAKNIEDTILIYKNSLKEWLTTTYNAYKRSDEIEHKEKLANDFISIYYDGKKYGKILFGWFKAWKVKRFLKKIDEKNGEKIRSIYQNYELAISEINKYSAEGINGRNLQKIEGIRYYQPGFNSLKLKEISQKYDSLYKELRVKLENYNKTCTRKELINTNETITEPSLIIALKSIGTSTNTRYNTFIRILTNNNSEGWVTRFKEFNKLLLETEVSKKTEDINYVSKIFEELKKGMGYNHINCEFDSLGAKVANEMMNNFRNYITKCQKKDN